MSFCLTLRNLHSCTFCIRWALQWCACLPIQLCLLSRSCSSVQTFVVSLTSLHGSLQASLRLTNAYRRYPIAQETFTLWTFFEQIVRGTLYIYHSRHTHNLHFMPQKCYIREAARKLSLKPLSSIARSRLLLKSFAYNVFFML